MVMNERLTASIIDLQENIKELKRKLNMDFHNSSNSPSSEGYKRQNKDRILRKQIGRTLC